MSVGYARISTITQNEDRQIEALTLAGCEKIYLDKMSGKDTNRPQLKEMFTFIRGGAHLRGAWNLPSGTCDSRHGTHQRTRRPLARQHRRRESLQPGAGERTCDEHRAFRPPGGQNGRRHERGPDRGRSPDAHGHGGDDDPHPDPRKTGALAGDPSPCSLPCLCSLPVILVRSHEVFRLFLLDFVYEASESIHVRTCGFRFTASGVRFARLRFRNRAV